LGLKPFALASKASSQREHAKLAALASEASSQREYA
jgi:hypothetical protein